MFVIILGIVSALVGISMIRFAKESESVTTGLIGAGILIAGTLAIFIGKGEIDTAASRRNYTQSLGGSLEAVMEASDGSGDKYAVYDNKYEQFQPDYLSEKYRTNDGKDVIGIIFVEHEERETGHYSNGDKAMQYILHLRLMDVATGKYTDTETLYGGDPPKSITSKTLRIGTSNHYGSFPSIEKIQSTCDSMVNKDQKERARRARVVLMSEEELVELVSRLIGENAGEDGWISVSKLTDLIENESPDFKFSDYGYSAKQFFTGHDEFEYEEGSKYSYLMYYPSYVRLANVE